MPLITEVQNRYSVQILANLTNPQDSTSATADISRLTLACNDIESEFTRKGMTYDSSPMTISAAVEGVIVLLRRRQGQTSGETEWQDYLKDLDRLRMITANNRIKPVSDRIGNQGSCSMRQSLLLRHECEHASFDGYKVISGQDNIFITQPNPDWRANMEPECDDPCDGYKCYP
jgi:hypothetical protein